MQRKKKEKKDAGKNIRISTKTFNLLKDFVTTHKEYQIGGLADVSIVEKVESLKSEK